MSRNTTTTVGQRVAAAHGAAMGDGHMQQQRANVVGRFWVLLSTHLSGSIVGQCRCLYHPYRRAIWVNSVAVACRHYGDGIKAACRVRAAPWREHPDTPARGSLYIARRRPRGWSCCVVGIYGASLGRTPLRFAVHVKPAVLDRPDRPGNRSSAQLSRRLGCPLTRVICPSATRLITRGSRMEATRHTGCSKPQDKNSRTNAKATDISGCGEAQKGCIVS